MGYCQAVAGVPEIDRSSTTERVADALREMLFAGDLRPGEPLREVALADGFHVARSTVREALQLLIAEGLLTRTPNKGVTVTALTEQDLAEVFDARLVLESAGIRAGVAGADLSAAAEALRAYADAAQSDDYAAATQSHLAFHNSLVALAGNSRLLGYANALTGDLRLALGSVERARRNARQQVGAHRKLLTFIRAGDEWAALEELAHHLSGARESVAERLRGH